jgi:hypothetical protein
MKLASMSSTYRFGLIILQLSIGRLSSENYQQTHLNGALALIRHRGAENFKNKLSVAILLYVRSLVVCSQFPNIIWPDLMPPDRRSLPV